MNECCSGKRTAEELPGDRFEGAHPITRTGLILWLFLSGEYPLLLFSNLGSGHPDSKPPLPPAKAQLLIGRAGIVCFVSWLLGKRTFAASEKPWFLSVLNENRKPDSAQA